MKAAKREMKFMAEFAAQEEISRKAMKRGHM